jgi:hypothetical protein
MSRFTRRLSRLRVEDANGLGMYLTPTDGDFSMGSTNKENAEHTKCFDRDQHDGFVLGQDMTQEWSVVMHMENQSLTHAVNARLLDFIHQRGAFEFAVSVDDTIWAFKLIAEFDDGVNTGSRTLPICEGGETLSIGNNHGIPVDV